MGRKLGDPVRPAAGQRPLGRQVLHARDDGHGPEPRAERPERQGPGPGHQRRALRLRLLPPVHRHVRPDRARHRGSPVRRALREGQGPGRRRRRLRDPGRGAGRAGRGVQAGRATRDGQGLPAEAPRPAPRRGRGGVQQLERRPGGGLPRARAHQPRPGHGRERPDDGVRQPRRQLGNGRGVHPRRRHGRERPLRRLPRQRPGRGRGRRHPQHRGPRPPEAPLPRDPRRAPGHLPAARAALPRHVRHRVHDRAGQALDAPDARRQAHRRGGAEDGRRHDQGPPHQAVA